VFLFGVAMAYLVYVLRSREGYRYIGRTGDMEAGLRQHNGGESPSAKHGHDWKVIHLESYWSRREAMQREQWLKSGVGSGVAEGTDRGVPAEGGAAGGVAG